MDLMTYSFHADIIIHVNKRAITGDAVAEVSSVQNTEFATSGIALSIGVDEGEQRTRGPENVTLSDIRLVDLEEPSTSTLQATVNGSNVQEDVATEADLERAHTAAPIQSKITSGSEEQSSSNVAQPAQSNGKFRHKRKRSSISASHQAESELPNATKTAGDTTSSINTVADPPMLTAEEELQEGSSVQSANVVFELQSLPTTNEDETEISRSGNQPPKETPVKRKRKAEPTAATVEISAVHEFANNITTMVLGVPSKLARRLTIGMTVQDSPIV
jgi:hypothetical protein